ncbi:MAG TPA: alpha/beta fold hydrolase [Acidimicrobiales bacterium]|jgi:pimeloyl-ACP methyl ester carboxylesterase|nr:alpha/beta fold hydrolase [Acidimicrobiales bacterium]
MPHELRRFRDGDLTLSYEVHGTGERTLVYLHGLLLDAAVNRRLARALADEGNRVVLLDLPGHGASDRPRQAAAHRMDAYARRVLHLLEELGVDRAVVGGMSLGADVALQLAYQAPERLAGMVLEMPVLEDATPFAALLFTPLLSLTHYAEPLLRKTVSWARRVPRHRLGLLDQYFGPLLLEPEEIVAVLHGVLVGPVAPTAEQRQAMTMPALVIGHGADRLHPLGDARLLAGQLPNARLVEANSLFELRVAPGRLTREIAGFLDEVWAAEAAGGRSAVGV